VKRAVCLLAAALGCSPVAHAPATSDERRAPLASADTETPDAPFRQRAPDVAPEPAFAPPRIDVATLSNGVRVLVVERRELPVVSVEIVMKAGFADFDGDVPEAYLLMAALLEQGTASRSASQIADGYRAIGAEHRAWVDFDSSGASVKTLSTAIDSAIDLLSDVVTHAAFSAEELEVARTRWTSWAKYQRLAIERRAASALAASVYGGDHPYGRTTLPRSFALAKVTRDDVLRVYARAMTPGRATIVVAGDVSTATLVPKLEAAFGQWARSALAPTRIVLPPVAAAPSARVVLCDAPKTTQPRVMLAEPGIAQRAPDRDAVVVMNEILGGAYSSRIFRNLRETHAYTYGAFSSFAMRHGAGPFSAGGAFDAAHVGDAIRELVHEITAMRDADVSPDELAAAKRHLVLALPARFESASDVTRSLATIVAHDLPLDEWSTFAPRIDAVSVADVRRAAQAHLHPDQMKIIVTGDRRTLEPILAGLGLGPVELRDADGLAERP
jgi:predicted Zn-dependent peptidase